jgi:hypothetical protein
LTEFANDPETGELELGRLRPGVEIFVKGIEDEMPTWIAGPGVIADFGAFDVRLGFHAGLNREAADFTASLWVATAIPLRGPKIRPGPGERSWVLSEGRKSHE